MSKTSWPVILIISLLSFNPHHRVSFSVTLFSTADQFHSSDFIADLFSAEEQTVNTNLYKTLSLFPALSASLSVSGECESCRGKSYWSWPRPSQPANKSLTSREEPNENVRLKKSVCGRERLIGRGLLKHLAVWRTAPAPGPAWIWIHWETFNGLS